MVTQPVKPRETLSLDISGETLGEETLFSSKVATIGRDTKSVEGG
jgi:hypothetical protein